MNDSLYASLAWILVTTVFVCLILIGVHFVNTYRRKKELAFREVQRKIREDNWNNSEAGRAAAKTKADRWPTYPPLKTYKVEPPTTPKATGPLTEMDRLIEASRKESASRPRAVKRISEPRFAEQHEVGSGVTKRVMIDDGLAYEAAGGQRWPSTVGYLPRETAQRGGEFGGAGASDSWATPSPAPAPSHSSSSSDSSPSGSSNSGSSGGSSE